MDGLKRPLGMFTDEQLVEAYEICKGFSYRYRSRMGSFAVPDAEDIAGHGFELVSVWAQKHDYPDRAVLITLCRFSVLDGVYENIAAARGSSKSNLKKFHTLAGLEAKGLSDDQICSEMKINKTQLERLRLRASWRTFSTARDDGEVLAIPCSETQGVSAEVEGVFNSVPDKYKFLLDAVYIQGRTFEEIGSEIGCSRQAVQTKTARAVKKVRGAFAIKKC